MRQETKKLIESIAEKYPYVDVKAMVKATPKEFEKIKNTIPESVELQRLLILEEKERKERVKKHMHRFN